MQMTNEAIKIDRAFKDAGLQPLHFKGPVLAQIAFGSVALKYSHDLDIFVTASEVRTALQTIERAGYRVIGPNGALSPRKIAALTLNFKHIGFVGPTGTLIEVHWRFSDGSGPLTGLENNLQRQAVKVANAGVLETFNSEQMLMYLVLHGAAHHWYRLKWLADLAAFLDQLPSDERDQVIWKVHQGPASNALAQALQLCDTLFDTAYSPMMSRRSDALYHYALNRIDRPHNSPGRLWGDIGFINDVLAKRHLHHSFWSTIWALKSHLICQGDVLAVPLPRYLNGIYPIIRLPSFLLRRLRGSRQGRAPNTR
jgi:hypothetical protein